MPRNTELQQRKEADIKAEFKRLLAEKKWHTEYVLAQVGHKFYLSTATVERICWGQYDAHRTRAANRCTAPAIAQPSSE